MAPVNVSILGETSVGVSVTGNVTGVAVSISGSTGVSVAATGGIGPAGFITAPGTSTNAFGTFQLAAGNGITLSTANGQFLISSYDTASVTQLAPVKSVAGRTGDVVLQAADITAGTFSLSRIPTHTHSTTEVASFSEAAAAAAPVQSVQGRTGTVTLSRLDVTAAAAAHTHSTADVDSFAVAAAAVAPVQSVQGRTGTVTLSRADVTAAAEVHTHSTADIVGLTAVIGTAASVVSVAGRTGVVTLSSADVSGLATIATSGSGSDLSSGIVPVARLPVATTTALGIVQVGSGLSISSGVLSAAGGGGGGGVSWVSVPSTPTSSGTAGQFAQNSTYLFACYGTDQWLRVTRAAWVVPPDAPTITSTGGSHQPPSPYVSFNWSAPANNGGELTNYVVQRDAESAVTVAADVNTYTFSGLTTSSGQCNIFTVTVKAQDSSGLSTAASTTIALPQTIVPTIHSINKTPNEMGPGVEYSVYWFPPCMTAPWTEYEVQARLYLNSGTPVEQGSEENWEAFYSGANSSHTAWISTASGGQQWQFRVRAKNVVNGTLVSTSGWSNPTAY